MGPLVAIRRASLVALIALAASAANLTGIVKDPSGAPVPGVAIDLRAVPSAGAPKTAHTDASGAFRFPGLVPGRYRVHIVQRGFQPLESDAVLEEGKDVTLELNLRVAELRETVEVSGGRRATIDTLYHALRDSSLGDALLIENVTLRRDNGVLTLKSGALAFTAPVLGRETEAVFTGDGEFSLNPATPVEKNHLRLLTDQDTVRESFDRAFFCFTDKTAEDIRAQAKAHGADAKLPDALRDFRKRLRSRTEEPRSMLEYMLTSETMDNVDADILADLYNPAQSGFFSAYLHGRKHSDLRFMVKPRGVMPDLAPEEVAVIDLDPQGEQEGIWYLAHLNSEIAAGKADSDQDLRVVRVESYRIETAIGKNDHFSATAAVTFRAVTDGDRVIKFALLPNLRVTRVSSGGKDVPFIQEDRREDGSFHVVLPQPMARDSVHELLIEYSGDKVVRKAGGGNFSVGARESWYPSLNTFRDHARYDLVFKVPKQYTLVSVGKLEREWTEQDFACSQWSSQVPIAVAGFNYGTFKRKDLKDPTSGFEMEGYANAELPDYLRGAEAIGGMSPTRLTEQTLVETENAMRLYNNWFGKSEFPRIAITQQPEFNFGQSWPTLVYLPLSAYLDSTQRWRLMGIQNRLTEFIDEVTPHEVSHQWWGHMVGWSSYHDQWLSEGFAFFSAALYLQFTEKDEGKFLKYWEHAHDALLQKNTFGKRPNDAGPVWLGLRLAYFKAPGAYNAVTYRKGGYVLHMLRMMMWDFKEGDKPFIEMMHDFVAKYTNRNASTEDFQHVAEQHMRPSMDAGRNGKLDWFFNEWIYGTSVPKYKFEYTLTPQDGGKFLLKGSLTQSDVTPDFVMPVPVYYEFNGQIHRLGQIRMAGNTTLDELKVVLPMKPKRVFINAHRDVLEQ